MTIQKADTHILKALKKQVCSGAQLLVTHQGQIAHQVSYGVTSWENDGQAVTNDTIFDLASLTKPLATATAIALLVQRGEIDLDDKIAKYLPTFETQEITIRHFLQHSAGLPDWKPYFESLKNEASPKEAIFKAIAKEKTITKPGQKTLYSDLDYMILGQLIEKLSQKTLDQFVEQEIYAPLENKNLFFMPLDSDKRETILREKQFVATEGCPRRGMLSASVHDDNCYFAGGVMGHAGLFGNADGVYQILKLWQKALRGESELLSKKTAQRFVFPNQTPALSSYVLGWDRPTWKQSTAGKYISPHSIGHLGFTGTSCWLDFEKDIAIILLTNRVHPSRDKNAQAIKDLRIKVHTEIYQALGATHKGPFTELPTPAETKHIHLTAVAGTGMGSLAGMLKSAGYDVTGSDQAIYPPMSTLLENQQIKVKQPFAAENLADNPDLVVVGNVCTRDHTEVVEIKRRNLPHDSLPGVLEKFFLADKQPLVVTGTHGKTTTSSMLSWLLESAGYDPGFMIGGLVQNFDSNYKLGKGPYFVVEGDEYDSAYFDKYPKFMHYKPFGAIITSIEFDHADIFDTLEEIEQHFCEFVKLIPPTGCLVACWDYETVRNATKYANCKVLSYGSHPDAEWRAAVLVENENGCEFVITQNNAPQVNISLPMSGRHNIDNALAAAVLLLEFGYPVQALHKAFANFKGIARRQQVKGIENGVRIIDDFAHHPTAVRLTLDGLRKRYPKGKLLVAFDPRTNTSSRNVFQQEFAESFKAADMVWVGDPSRMDRIAKEERMDVDKLAHDLELAGQHGKHLSDMDQMAKDIIKNAESGDTIAVLSNGSFAGIHGKLLEGLRK